MYMYILLILKKEKINTKLTKWLPLVRVITLTPIQNNLG